MISKIDKAIVRFLQVELPLVSRPYKALAETLGIEESEVLERVQRLQDDGVLRRIGAILHHRKTGFGANAMVVWAVPEKRLDEVGAVLASYPQVTHCYHRTTDNPNWEFNLYSMVHGCSREACGALVEEIAKSVDVPEYETLYSSVELKKVSMRYFEE